MDSSSRPRHALTARSASELDSFVADAALLVRWLAVDVAPRRRHGQRWGRLLRLLVVPWVWLARGIGAVASGLRTQRAPALLVPAPSVPPRAEPTLQWLLLETQSLPECAQQLMQTALTRIECVTAQLRNVSHQRPERAEFGRLVNEELRELVRSYRRLPAQLTSHAAYGSASPDEQLCTGLQIVSGRLLQLQERLAAEDLRTLSVQFRYLSLKYNPDGELSAQGESSHTR